MSRGHVERGGGQEEGAHSQPWLGSPLPRACLHCPLAPSPGQGPNRCVKSPSWGAHGHASQYHLLGHLPVWAGPPPAL